jgi:hypothetical protein
MMSTFGIIVDRCRFSLEPYQELSLVSERKVPFLEDAEYVGRLFIEIPLESYCSIEVHIKL